MDFEKLMDCLTSLVRDGLVEMGLDEKGEIVYWMTDEQKEKYEQEG